MRFGSVCSGIEAASVAWGPLGWKAAWLSEIEPFPSAVLAHHYPDVPNLGDMTALPARIRSGEVEAPDLFCGGTPCQAFSVAGLRNSLDDARGNLSLVFCEIANAIDEVRSVRGLDQSIIFWENVPGVLSTKDNAFGCFLAGLAGEEDPVEPPRGKWPNAGVVLGPQRTVAWRVLDAQYFGLAQRRRRVFVVASARDDFDPASVLFEFDGVRRDSAPSREAGKVASPSTGASAEGGSGVITMAHGQGGAEIGFNRGPTLTCNHEAPIAAYALQHAQIGRKDSAGPQGKGWQADVAFTQDSRSCADAVAIVPTQPIPFDTTQITSPANYSRPQEGDPCHPLAAGAHVPAVAQPISYGIRTANTSSNGWGIQEEVTHTLDCAQGVAVAQPMPINTMIALRHEALGEGTGFGIGEPGDPSYTLTKGHSHAVAQPITFGMDGDVMGEVMETITTREGNITDTAHEVSHPPMQVRRLTPVECERLQGFPDNYTQIPWRKKPAEDCPDGPRYKALGNSWAVPVVRWIGARIAKAA